MFLIHRTASRFARGATKNAINFVEDHREIQYATEDAAFERVCQEVAMLAAKYRVDPDMSRSRRTTGVVVIYADGVGVVYTVRRCDD